MEWGASSRITATVVAFSINYACYFSVIFRGGIEGVPVGQREAGEVLGMTKKSDFLSDYPAADGKTGNSTNV